MLNFYQVLRAAGLLLTAVDMCAGDGKYWWMGDSGDAFNGNNNNGVQNNYQQNNSNYQQTNGNNVRGRNIIMLYYAD